MAQESKKTTELTELFCDLDLEGLDGCAAPEAQTDCCYRNDLEYLEDIRSLVNARENGLQSGHFGGGGTPNPLAEEISSGISRKRRASRINKAPLALVKISDQYRLDELSERILGAFILNRLTGEDHESCRPRFFRALAGSSLAGIYAARKSLAGLIERGLVLRTTDDLGLRGTYVSHDIFAYVIEGRPLPPKRQGKKTAPRADGPTLSAKALSRFPDPRAIRAELDKHVVGQDEAKRMLSVAAFTHLKRVVAPDAKRLKIKPNLMLVGPTGCGKTHIVKTLAEILGLPFAIGDASTWTEVGYVGCDYDEVLWRLKEAAGGNIAVAQCGIIFIDEIDKISAAANTRKAGGNIRGDVSGAGVQRALLKPLEGSVVKITENGFHGSRTSPEEIDTANILFICGGAFTGIRGIMERRTLPRDLGFGVRPRCPERSAASPAITHDDLIDYGMLTELMGRIARISPVHALTRGELIEIMTREKVGLIEEINESARFSGLTFLFGRDALEAIADRALTIGTGARSLKGALDAVTERYLYELGGSDTGEVREIRITAQDLAKP